MKGAKMRINLDYEKEGDDDVDGSYVVEVEEHWDSSVLQKLVPLRSNI